MILGVRSSVFLPFRRLGLVIVDESADIDRTLYTLGFSSQDGSDRIDTEIAVLAQPVSLENVKSVTINDVTYAMAYR